MPTQSTAPEGYARLSCRVSAKIKKRAEEAAALLGQSITDFTESALIEKAQETFDQHERIVLSQRNFDQFVASIDNPAPPTEKLRQAMAEYQKLRLEHPEYNL